MIVRFTPSAWVEFRAIVEYIAVRNRSAAVRFRARVERALRPLERFPDAARVVPEDPDGRYREVIVAPYRFMYRREGKTVWIATVRHAARLVELPTK